VTQQQWRKHEQECSLLIRDVTQQGQQQTEWEHYIHIYIMSKSILFSVINP
jgi:hypothetical protein